MQYNGGNGPRDDRNRQYARLPRQPQTSPVRPPENRPVRKKRRRIVVKPRFFVFLAVCVLLLVGLFSGVRALVRLLVNNDAAISYGMIEDVTTVDALIVRSETCVRAESYGKIDYLVPEESYVSAGTPVVNVYATGYSSEKMTELENLMTDIQQRQKQALGSIINVTIDDYNNSISAQTAAIRSAIAGDPAQLDTLDQQLRTLMSARQDYIEKTTEAKEDATLAQYYASKTQLQSQISTWMTQYPADNAGFVSFTFDGLEPYLNPDTLDALDGAAVKELLRESNPAVPDELRILSLDEVLDYLTAAGEFRYIIEIKDGGETGLAAADQLYATLKERGLLDRVIIGSFRDEVAAYITVNYPDTHRSASPEEVVQFYFAALTGKKDFTCSYDVLQLPFGDARESYGLNLGTTTIINFAHAHDLAMQYWTVNDEADLAYLASVGADALITDYPDRAAAVLQGMG